LPPEHFQQKEELHLPDRFKIAWRQRRIIAFGRSALPVVVPVLLFALHRPVDKEGPISMRKTRGFRVPQHAPRREGSALALLVPRVGADHAHDAFAAHDLALLTHALDRRTNLHDQPPRPPPGGQAMSDLPAKRDRAEQHLPAAAPDVYDYFLFVAVFCFVVSFRVDDVLLFAADFDVVAFFGG
jgi:hypothetical protein